MRVLIILKYIPSVSYHQKSDLLRTSIAAYEKAGFEVVLFTMGASSKHEWQEIKTNNKLLVKTLNYFNRRLLKGAGFNLNKRVARKVASYHQRHPIDLVFAECNSNNPAEYAHAIKKVTGVPYVVREHRAYASSINTADELPRKYLQAIQSADKVIAVSPVLADRLEKIGISSNVGVIPNALSEDFFKYPASHGRFRDWAGDSFLFSSWTRWRELKRLDLILEAYAKFLDTGYQGKLIIAGPVEGSSNQNRIHSYLQINGFSDKVWLTGQISRPEIHKLAYDSDCCVIASDYETFGLPAIESLAAGTPVLTTKCGGPEYIINNTGLGHLVDCGSSEALFCGMVSMYEKRNSYNAEQLKEQAYNRFSCSAMSKHLVSLADNILEERSNNNAD